MISVREKRKTDTYALVTLLNTLPKRLFRSGTSDLIFFRLSRV